MKNVLVDEETMETPATVIVASEQNVPIKNEKKKKKKKKPVAVKLAILVAFVIIAIVIGYFAKSFVAKLTEQSVKPIVNQISAIETDSLKITGQSPSDTLEMAYDLSAIAYIPTTENEWYDVLKAHNLENIQRVENSIKFPFDHETMEEKDGVKFFFSSVNATIASRNVTIDGENKTLILVAFRGTEPSNIIDAVSDMYIAVNQDGVHKGFAWNATNFYDKKDNIGFKINGEQVMLGTIIEEMKKKDSKYVMLAVGHSLGAAVADTFVGYTLAQQDVLPSNTLAITFASPRAVVSTFKYKHDNIINVINSDDWIPTIAGDKHIGNNFVYTPENAFREKYYGIGYVKDAESSNYSSPIGATVTGFKNHDIHTTYKGIVEEINSNDKYFE